MATSEPVHSRPGECGPEHGDWYMCIEGLVYGPCSAPECGGVCEPEGRCTCSCHEQGA